MTLLTRRVKTNIYSCFRKMYYLFFNKCSLEKFNIIIFSKTIEYEYLKLWIQQNNNILRKERLIKSNMRISLMFWSSFSHIWFFDVTKPFEWIWLSKNLFDSQVKNLLRKFRLVSRAEISLKKKDLIWLWKILQGLTDQIFKILILLIVWGLSS